MCNLDLSYFLNLVLVEANACLFRCSCVTKYVTVSGLLSVPTQAGELPCHSCFDFQVIVYNADHLSSLRQSKRICLMPFPPFLNVCFGNLTLLYWLLIVLKPFQYLILQQICDERKQFSASNNLWKRSVFCIQTRCARAS